MLETRVRELLEEKKYAELKKTLEKVNEVDLAELLQELGPKHTLLVFRMLPKDMAAEVFAEMTKEQRADILHTMTDHELEEVLDDLYFNEMIDVLEEMPASVVRRIVGEAPPEERQLINEFLKYPKDSAGSVMTIEYMELKPGMTVRQALAQIQSTGMTRKTIYTCYVTNFKRQLVGFVSLRELIVADEEMYIEDLMTENVVSVEVHEDQEDVAQIFLRYGFLALPVVDSDNMLIGIITVDEIMEVMEEEATEDFQIIAATTPSETEYLETNVLTLAKNRVGWLLILMFSSIISAAIIRRYSDLLSRVIILNTFIPIIMGTGGNAGAQTATLVTRALATGDVKLSDALQVFWKEFRVAIICGVTLSIVNFFRLYFLGHAGSYASFGISLTILAVVIVAKISGAALPLLAKRIGVDPALMAGPLITTIVDALGLLVYFNIMSGLLSLLV